MTFEEIYRANAGRILKLVSRMTQNREVARDLTQEVFLKVFDNLASFRREAEVSTWIHRIAVNHTLNYLKREKRARGLGEANEIFGRVVQHGKALREPIDESRGAAGDAALEDRERAEVVQGAIRALPGKYRVPLVLFHYEGRSYQEVAVIMGLSLSAVESRIHRAKKMMIDILGPLARQL